MSEETGKKKLKYSVGENVKRLRLKANLKVSELARRAGISVNFICRIEKKNQNLSLGVAYEIAKALRVTMEELILKPSPESHFINVDYCFFEDFVAAEINAYKEITPSVALIIYDEYKDDIWHILHAEAARNNVENTWEFISRIPLKSTDYWMQFEFYITKYAISLILKSIEVSDE